MWIRAKHRRLSFFHLSCRTCFGLPQLSPIIPFGSIAFLALRPVRRLQQKMVFTARERERESEIALCCTLLSFASDGSHYWAFKACFMSVCVRCPFPPLLCLVVRGLARLPACVCVLRWGTRLEHCLQEQRN